jgi:sulfite exporter TauE/SafE/copper chaperone CopZ
MDYPQYKKAKLKIHGMHCASCEVLVERKFKKVAGIEKVSINHANGKAEIVYSIEPNIKELNDLIGGDGYSVSQWNDRNSTVIEAVDNRNTIVDYLQMVWIMLVLVSLYFILKQTNFLPSFSISEHMSYGVIFLIGLFAAVSSCIAVVGGLLLALAGKYNEANPGLTGIQKFRPHLYFNVGRIVGYTFFGAAVGALGSVLTLSPRTNGLLMVIVSAVMLLLGFQLLNLFPALRRFSPKMPKFISHKIHDLSAVDNKGAPFTLGALTFFLPCGFTQALQLYVLAIGDWKVGALTMLTFALGTMPALVSLSAISSFAKGAFQKYFLRFAGVLIVLLAIFNINNGLVLAGYNIDLASLGSLGTNGSTSSQGVASQIVNGKQIVKMKADGYTYTPNKFTVVVGVPVEWQIDGAGAAGCGRVVVMPTLGITKYLSTEGITTITFTPTETGTIPFNCSMGMMTRGSEFTVVQNTAGVVGAKIENENELATACDPTVSTCAQPQKLNIEVSQERGVYPRTLTAKKGIPIELTINDKVALSGCMSIWVIPKYGITIPMKGGVTKNTFTPTETGVLNITCSMGSLMARINVTD